LISHKCYTVNDKSHVQINNAEYTQVKRIQVHDSKGMNTCRQNRSALFINI